MATFRVVHRTDYVYDDVVTESHGRAHLLPRDEAGQRVVSTVIDIDPAPDEQHDHTDYFGNRSTYFRVSAPHRALSVTSTSVVEIDRLSAIPRALDDDLIAHELTIASPLIPTLAAVHDYALESFPFGRQPLDSVMDLVHRIHADFRYDTKTTTVSTPLGKVLEQRSGVCQDFAHLAIAALRSMGIPALYVSGYLETTPPPGRARLTGADASHAWVSALVPGVGWCDVDPTNDQAADDRYVVIARGRDYSDVPPLKGVIFTESTRSTMRVSVDVERSASG